MLLEWIGWAGSGPVIMNVIIIVTLIIGIIVGFFKGFVSSSVAFIEGFLLFLIAFLFKNPVSVFLYNHLPFFKFKIQVLNIVLYEFIAFIIVILILAVILYIINKFIRVIEKIFSFLLGLGLPSGVLGAIVFFVQFYIGIYFFIFLIFFFSALTGLAIDESLADKVFYDTPVLKSSVGPILSSCIDIAEISYKTHDDEKVDYKSLEVLLKYKILSSEGAKTLLDNGKLKINGSKDLLKKYS